MADNLTVQSRPDAAPASAPAPAAHADDKAAAELQALRALVRSRTGREVGDAVLEQLRDKRHARQTQAAKQAETKASFETAASKETLGTAAGSRDVQARRAVGAAELKGADGLSEKERTDVRGNLEAGPRLPPTLAKATTPEQAVAIAARIFENLQLEGQPLEPKAYASTLRQAAPTPGGRTGAAATRPATPQRPAVPASPRGPAGATAGQSPGLPGGAPALSLKLGGATRPAPQARAAEVNTGGRVESTTSFDGMHFNWDAFLMRFMISTAEDMGAWRKMLREMRDLASKATLMAMDVDINRTKMQQEMETLQCFVELIKSVGDVGKAWKAGEMNAMLGKNPRQAAADCKQLGELAKGVGKGRTLLTKDEIAKLQPKERAEYEALLGRLERNAGRLGMALLLRRELATLDDGPRKGPVGKELEQQAKACEDEARGVFASRSGDREAMQRLREGVTELREGFKDRSSEAAKQVAANPNDQAAKDEHASALSSLAGLDDQLFSFFGAGTKDFAAAEAQKLPVGDTRARLEAAAAGTTPPPVEKGGDQIKRLTARTAAGDHLLEGIGAPADSKAARLGKVATRFLGDFSTGLDKDAWNGHLAAVVNEAVQRAQASARERRVALDQMIQQATREAQGMINQLLVTGLHRS